MSWEFTNNKVKKTVENLWVATRLGEGKLTSNPTDNGVDYAL